MAGSQKAGELMLAMILAAGEGTRLHPLTYGIPKPMVPIANIPVMEHIIQHLKKHGFREIVVNLSYLGEQIESHFGDGSGFGVKIHYSQEDVPLGTAGGVKRVASLFHSTFLIIGGDDLTDMDLGAIIRFHRIRGALATIALSRVADPTQYGIVVMTEDGEVKSFQEKPEKEKAASDWANTGIYVFESQILELIPERTFYDFGMQLFPLLLESKAPFFACKVPGYWRDIGDIASYRQAHFDVLEGRTGIHIPGRRMADSLWVEEGVEIAPDAEISGPVLLGKNCRIGEGCRLIGPLVLGEGTAVSRGSVLERSILWKRNVLSDGTVIRESLIGNGCFLGEGTNLEGVIVASGSRIIPGKRKKCRSEGPGWPPFSDY